MISYGSTAIELSSKDIHPMFSRVVASNSLQATSMIDLCFRLGWTERLALLGSNDQYGISGRDALKDLAATYNMEVLHDEILIESTKSVLRRVKEKNSHYILTFAVSVMIKPILVAARELDMLNGDYVFIFGESFGNIIEVKDGIARFLDGEDNDLLLGQLFMQSSTGFWTASDVFLRTEWGKAFPGVQVPALAPYIYDSFLAYASAIDDLLSEHPWDDVYNGTLLFSHIVQQDFLATTGRVIFGPDGDRISSPYILTNIDNNRRLSEITTWEVGRTFRMDKYSIILPGGKEAELIFDSTVIEIIGSTFNFYPIPDSSTPPAYRYSASCSYNYRDHQMVLFGGRVHAERRFSDFWIYDLRKSLWRQIFSFRAPSARSEHVSFVWTSSSDELYYSIFGGFNGIAILEEQWNYRFSLNSWFQGSNVPVQARLRARTTNLNRDTYLVAGEGILDDRNDVWRFNYDSESWHEEKPVNSDVFIPRRDHCLTVYRGSLIVWAGRNEQYLEGLDDMYMLSLQTKQWEEIFPGGDYPVARYNPVCETYNNKFYGGMGFSFHPESPGVPYGDFFKMDLEPEDGVFRFELLNIPYSRGFEGRDHVEWIFFGDKIMFFGGWGEHYVLNDFVRFSMEEEKVELVHEYQETPPNVHSHTEAIVGNSVYIYGGTTLDGDVHHSNDMYKLSLDSFKWQQVFARGRQPLPTGGHVSVVIGDLIFVHGGLSATGYLNDLWQYSTKRNLWTQIEFDFSQSVPTARAYHTGQVIENAATGRRSIFLMGGAIKHALLHDLWEFNLDLHQFTEVFAKSTPGVKPPAAVVHMQSAVINSHILVFGGEDRSVAPLKSVFAFSPESYEWSIFAHVPDELQTSRSRIAASNDALYIYGGSFFDKLTDILLEVRNGSVRQLSLEQSAVRPERRSGHSLLLYQSRLLIFGGIGAIPSKTLLSDITIYNNLFEYRLSPCSTNVSLSQEYCVLCTPGTFRRLDSCVPCDEGHYTDQFGSFGCIPCDIGFYNPLKGASSSKLCYPCEPGFYQDTLGSSECKPCDKDKHFCPIGSTSPLSKDLEKIRDGKVNVRSFQPPELPDKGEQMQQTATVSAIVTASLVVMWLLIFLLSWYWLRRCLFIADLFFNEKHNYQVNKEMRRKKTVAGGWFSILFVVLWIAAGINIIIPFYVNNLVDIKTLTPLLGSNTLVSVMNVSLTFHGPPKLQCTANGDFDTAGPCHSSLQITESSYNFKSRKLTCRKWQMESNSPPYCSIEVVYSDFSVDSSMGIMGIVVNEDNSFASYFSWDVTATSGYPRDDSGHELRMSTANGEKFSQQDTLFRGMQQATILSLSYIQTLFFHRQRVYRREGVHLENLLVQNGSYVDSSSFSSRNGFKFEFNFDVAENYFQIERTGKKGLLQMFSELGGATSLLLTSVMIFMRVYESAQSIFLNSKFAKNSPLIQHLRHYKRVKDRLEIVDEIKKEREAHTDHHRTQLKGQKLSSSSMYVEMSDMKEALLQSEDAAEEDILAEEFDEDRI
uniref:Tyrosine-protein kinase ephrin type A/B receptor-like domain-containing protein n=1 Tax=Percolomonas cosmopolitus TaxID=63605 RepID=A0A7S1KTP2_9EUKA